MKTKTRSGLIPTLFLALNLAAQGASPTENSCLAQSRDVVKKLYENGLFKSSQCVELDASGGFAGHSAPAGLEESFLSGKNIKFVQESPGVHICFKENAIDSTDGFFIAFNSAYLVSNERYENACLLVLGFISAQSPPPWTPQAVGFDKWIHQETVSGEIELQAGKPAVVDVYVFTSDERIGKEELAARL